MVRFLIFYLEGNFPNSNLLPDDPCEIGGPKEGTMAAQAIKEGTTGLLIRGSRFIGLDVKNKAGENLGDIEDIMVDFSAGRIAYLVLSFGSVIGVGGKYFALPPDIFEYSQVENCLLLNVDKKRLETAPGFDKDNWPDMADRSYGSKIYKYYGTEPYWEHRVH